MADCELQHWLGPIYGMAFTGCQAADNRKDR